MSEELGECPNNTENTVCLSPSCKYKHDRTWPIPPSIQEVMDREFDYESSTPSAAKNLQPIEWTLEHELSFESYVDRMLNYPSKCPCGCGGQFVPPAKKASIETIQCTNCGEVVLNDRFDDHYCAEYLHGPDPINQTDKVEVLTLQDLERLKKETEDAQGNDEE